MMAAPVSVIIPHFNGSATIDRALQSVAGQTLSCHEVIVVDDRSDETEWVELQRVCSTYDFVKLVRLERNSGPGTARNVGWSMASQPYLAFLDADDEWTKNKIALQYPAMKAQNWCLLGANILTIGRNAPRQQERHGPYQITRLAILKSNPFATSSVMLKRATPLRFPEQRYCEDYELWMGLTLSGERVGLMDMVAGFRHKDVFGDSGQSSKLHSMALGELRAYHQATKRVGITPLAMLPLGAWSILRHGRRLVHSKLSSWRTP